MKFYESKHSGKIIDENALKFAKQVYGDQVDYDMNDGLIFEIDPPDVVTLLKRGGSFTTAVNRYMEIHNCSYTEAVAGTRSIYGLMNNLKKKKAAK